MHAKAQLTTALYIGTSDRPQCLTATTLKSDLRGKIICLQSENCGSMHGIGSTVYICHEKHIVLINNYIELNRLQTAVAKHVDRRTHRCRRAMGFLFPKCMNEATLMANEDLTFFTISIYIAERTVARVRVFDRVAPASIQARLSATRVVTTVDVDACQCFLAQLHRSLIDNHLYVMNIQQRMVSSTDFSHTMYIKFTKIIFTRPRLR